MPSHPRHAIQNISFTGRSGGIVDQRVEPVPHSLLVLGHTSSIPPWSDPNIHIHQHSEEFYLLLHGELEFYIAGARLTLQPHELLVVLPGVPHAVIGGRGRIEHFGIRAPSVNDKQVVSEIPVWIPSVDESDREFRRETVGWWDGVQ